MCGSVELSLMKVKFRVVVSLSVIVIRLIVFFGVIGHRTDAEPSLLRKNIVCSVLKECFGIVANNTVL